MKSSDPQSDAQQRIVQLASSDPEFRARLLQDPRATVQDYLGIPLPGNVGVRVIEEQPGEVVLVLPSRTLSPGSALSDADLEAVAGGGSSGDHPSWDGPCIC